MHTLNPSARAAAHRHMAFAALHAAALDKLLDACDRRAIELATDDSEGGAQ